MIDIGGGLPVGLGLTGDDDDGPTFQELASELRRSVPGLFERSEIVTEFGRAVSSRCAVVLSRVEYTKVSGGRNIATCHVGADLFLRTAYVPDRWPLRVSILTADGTLKTEKDAPLVQQDIAGPLCFSGDLIARKAFLPLASPGDIVLIHDAGAYTYSMWSHYNLRVPPPVAVCWDGDDSATVIKRCTHDDAVGMFRTPVSFPTPKL